MFVDGEQQQSRWLVVDVGQVCAFESRVGRQSDGVGEVEAEGQTALEPGLDGMAIGRDHLRRRSTRESSEMLVEEFRSRACCFDGTGASLRVRRSAGWQPRELPRLQGEEMSLSRCATVFFVLVSVCGCK